MLAIGAALAAALLVVLANVHLVYVSIQSQPECVAHLKPGSRGDSGAWSAARSSC
jgi:hypothetical protein